MSMCTDMKARVALSLVFVFGMLSTPTVFATETNAKRSIAQAQAELGAGNITRAELLFGRAMQELPNDVGPAMSLAEIYMSQHRFDEAERLIAKTLQTQSADYRVWKAKGQLQRAQGNESEAIADYEKAFSLGGKEDAFVLQSLQQHYEKTGNAVRQKQMENNLQWLRMKGVR